MTFLLTMTIYKVLFPSGSPTGCYVAYRLLPGRCPGLLQYQPFRLNSNVESRVSGLSGEL
ncbi:MAG: hypothetical protein K940chlam7_01428 [Chlamydiae bacterium]|nr:hypothetical protein [Chlamydiota bacterium]